jgi:hypothetical protein
MSELAFDGNGEPITFPAEAEELRVRRFRNPGMRGACEVVHDRDGVPLYVPIDTSYVEFRRLVDGMPGRYRLDPTDAERRVIANSTPAYVTISDAPRGAPASGPDDRECVIRELARANADMAKTIADRFASVMQAAADLLRAADGAGLPKREPMAAAPVAPEEDEEDDDTDDDLDDEVDSPDIAALVAQLLPTVQMWLASKAAAKPAAAAPAAAPAPAPVPSAPVHVAAPVEVTGEPGPAAGAVPASESTAPASVPVSATPTGMEAPGARNAGLPSLGQAAHLMAIHARLTGEEKRIVELVVGRMTPADRSEWLAELSRMAVDDAAALVRSLIARLRTTKEVET